MDLSVCIPVFNDALNLNNLLRSISKNDVQNLDYEVIVCDSDSDDDVEGVVGYWSKKIPIKLIKSFKRASASVNLNVGLRESQGVIFCRIDSHCIIPQNYLREGVETLNAVKSNFSAVGPSVEITSSQDTVVGRAIASLYKSPFLLGPSKFKRSFFYKKFSGPIETIYLGFYITEDLRSINGFNEVIRRKQDIELLNRLKKFTGRGFYNCSELVVNYVLKQDNIGSFLARCMGQGKLLFKSTESSRPIHFMPLLSCIFFVFLALYSFQDAAFVLMIYLLVSMIFGFVEARNVTSLFVSVFLFPLAHSVYVCGNIVGLYQKSRKLT